jgi:hypothetical protein
MERGGGREVSMVNPQLYRITSSNETRGVWSDRILFDGEKVEFWIGDKKLYTCYIIPGVKVSIMPINAASP